MTKRFATMCLAAFLVVMAGAQPHGQQAEDRQKAAEREKAAQEQFNKMVAEQSAIKAEAEARAQLKVAEEARRAAEAANAERIARANAIVPIDVEVLISRFQGDKKVSSLPYAMTINAIDLQVNSPGRPLTRLRMGGRVPVPVTAPAVGPDGKSLTGVAGGGPVSYEEIGTNIDASARTLHDGRFELYISVSESAVVPNAQGSAVPGALPVIRTFQSSNNLVLRDGQTRQFTAASDRISGEVVKIDVTLKVVK